MATIDILLRAVGAATAKSDIKSVSDSAKGLGDAAADAATKAEALKGSLEKIRNAGVGIAAAGAATLVLSNHLSNAFLEADRLGGKLEAMLKGKGLGDSIGKVKELGNEIAALTGNDDDQVSAAIAGAIASGRLMGLREYGIVIDANGKAAIEAAGKISEQAKQQEILNQVLIAGKRAAADLKAGMDDSTASLGEMAVRWGNLEEGIGKGAARVKSALYEGLIDPIFDLLESSPRLQETVGGILQIGGAAASGIGSLVAFVAQIGMARMALTGSSLLGAAGGAGASGGLLGGIGTTIQALTGAGGLTSVLTVALPAAVAVGAALMLKAMADASFAARDKAYEDSLPGKDVSTEKTQAGAMSRAADLDRRAEGLDKEIQRLKDEKSVSWPINIFTGMTPAQYQQEIDNTAAEAEGYRRLAERERAAAKTLPMTAATATPAAATEAGTAAATKQAKAEERKAKAEERLRAKTEAAELGYAQQEAGLKAIEAEESANTRIAQLQAQLETARKAKNDAKVAELESAIKRAEIERDYSAANLRADATALGDERAAGIMRREAETRRKYALQRAAIESSKPTSGVMSRLGSLMTTLPAYANSTVFNPFAGKDYGSGGAMVNNIGGTARGNVTQDGRGNFVVQFEPLAIPNTMRQSAALLPGG